MRATEEKATRPFRIKVPEEALADLRRCLAAAKWTEKETVTDDSQGVALSLMQEVARQLGDGIRLAEGGGETECPASVHNRNRWARHPAGVS
jgi:hypothetical protein